MLVDTIANWRRYDFGPAWNDVMSWLEATLSCQDMADGKYKAGLCDIGVTTLVTRPRAEARYETHRRLCDVHMPLVGRELFLNTAATATIPDGDFDEAKDVGFHTLPGSGEAGGSGQDTARLTLVPGDFVLVFPWDAHMPSLAVDDQPESLRKCVAKIPLEALRLI